MIQKLKPVDFKPSYWRIVAKKLLRFWRDSIFQYLADVNKVPLKLEHDKGDSALSAAIRSGSVFYADGAFYAKTGQFSSPIAKEIEAMRAVYSRSKKSFIVSPHFMPHKIEQTIGITATKNQEKIELMRSHLGELKKNVDAIVRQISFEREFDGIVKDGEKQFRTSMTSINVIPYELDEARKKVLYENYNTNMQFYIKKWTEDEIEKLRTDVEGIVFQGYRYDKVATMIQKRYNVSARKASFLARNETKLLVAKYQQDRFQSYGVNFYQWKTNMDGRERPLHAKLNGTIQNWTNPPIIEERTGKTGNPGEIYNCRCKALPLLPNDARIKEGNRTAILQ